MPHPKKIQLGQKIRRDKWGDMGNLKINLCTVQQQGMPSWPGHPAQEDLKDPKMKEILNAYCALTNYDPELMRMMKALEALKFLKYWRK